MNPLRYGHRHKKIRRVYVAAYAPGDPCVLCRKPMTDDPSILDLAHAPGGHMYLGLAHRRCNRSEGQAAINRARAERERLGKALGQVSMPRREQGQAPVQPRSAQADPPGRSATQW